MSYAIYKVVDLAGGKITAKEVKNISRLPIQLQDENNNIVYYKFTILKSSDLDIEVDDSTTVEMKFKYKDNF